MAPSKFLGDSEAGVFAACDIAEGEVVTFFPADVVIPIASGEAEVNVMFGPRSTPAFVEKVRSDSTFRMRYQMTTHVVDNVPIHIIGDPTLTQDTDRIGHLINAHAKTSLCDLVDEDERMNVIVVDRALGAHALVLASRPIRKGEELLINYGKRYEWTS